VVVRCDCGATARYPHEGRASERPTDDTETAVRELADPRPPALH
jgi:hypothetical protein